MSRISPETESEPFDDTRKLHMALQQIAWWEEQCRQQIARIEELEAHGHAQTPAVPEGYVLIPREPTREMWAACGDAVVGNTSVHHDVVVRLIYRAIVAVADTSTDRGCGDPSCKDPNCTYGKGKPRCQRCGDPIAHGIYCGECRSPDHSVSSPLRTSGDD